MQQDQSQQGIQSTKNMYASELKDQSKYTSSQFYPKSSFKQKNSDAQTKSYFVSTVNKSACSEHLPECDQRAFNTSQTYDLHLNQKKDFKKGQNGSFTLKIIDHQFRNKGSNLINKKSIKLSQQSPQKIRLKLYDEIQTINNKEQRFKPLVYDHNISERLKEKRSNELSFSRKKNNVVAQNQAQSQLYRSLPQPFINKKHLTSFEAPISKVFKSEKQAKQYQSLKLNQQKNKELKLLQINNKQQKHQSISEMIDQLTKYSQNLNKAIQSSAKKTKYKKKKLEPLKTNIFRQKMSNNIKDYLSVERIKIKEIQNHLLSETTNSINEKLGSSIDINRSPNRQVSKKINKLHSTVGAQSQIKNREIKFVPPFVLYYYRDFIWKMGFSNELMLQSPTGYENKIKVYLSKGNNSNLIKGLIKRRPWYQLTEKYQEAQFVWSQIKIQPYLNQQKKSDKFIEYKQIESSFIEETKSIQPAQTLNDLQKVKFLEYWVRNAVKQMKFKESLRNRSKIMNIKQISVADLALTMKIHNHFLNNYVIGNKKALFSLMNKYYTGLGQEVFNYLPLTFHIKNGLEDDEYLKFLNHFYSISKQIKKIQDSQISSYIYRHNAWIVKPGENTNRGNGIIVCLNLNQVKAILKKKQKHNDGTYKTYILQKYIEKPLLYKRRKFDLRHYMLMSCSNGIIKGYWYKEGYVRTTSAEYTLKFNSGSVHLTNDAVQKQLPDYGKFQKGNKISYEDLNDYVKKSDSGFDFSIMVLAKMKKIATDLIRASAKLMDPQKRQNNFEIFGLDFMIDQVYNVWLIQCNSNPCLELSCPLLGRIIPRMVENVFRICLDPIFVPPLNFVPQCHQYYENINEENRFELVYDERVDISTKNQQKSAGSQFLQNKDFQQEDDTFDDDGEAWDD